METALNWAEVILGSAALLNFVQFLINRHDRKKAEKKGDALAPITKRLDSMEKDIEALRVESDLGNCRNQLLFLFEHRKNDTFQIMQVAEHYFKDLKGDWYMSSYFKDFLKENDIPKPIWFNDDTKAVK